MPVRRAASPTAEDVARQDRLIQATRTVRAALAELHDLVPDADQHSKGMVAILGYMTDTVTTIIEAKQLPAAKRTRGARV